MRWREQSFIIKLERNGEKLWREASERTYTRNMRRVRVSYAVFMYPSMYQVYIYLSDFRADLQAPSYRSTHLMIPLIERQDKNVKERSDRYKTKERYCKCKLGKASFKTVAAPQVREK